MEIGNTTNKSKYPSTQPEITFKISKLISYDIYSTTVSELIIDPSNIIWIITAAIDISIKNK